MTMLVESKRGIGRKTRLLGLGLSALLAACGAGAQTDALLKPDADATATPIATATATAATQAVATATADPIPTPTAPVDRAKVDVATSPSLVGLKEQEIFVRVRATGLPIVDKKRPPINIALVVDTSGSMDGPAITQARLACGILVDSLEDGDALSIVSFGSKPRVIVEATTVSAESKKSAKKAIEGIVAEGTTDMAGGLRAGLEQARAKLVQNGINRIVLVGDGVPNDSNGVLQLADQAKAQRIPVTTLGLGNDFDETLMTQLAQRSGGTFHFVDDASRVAKVFKEEISKMERLVAKSTWLEITPGPGVVVTEAVGMPASPSGRAWRVSLGDITEGQNRDVMFRVKVTGKRDGANLELMDATLHYTPAEGGSEMLANKFASLKVSSDAARLKDANVVEIDRQATRLVVADGIVRAIGLARSGDVFGARKLLATTQKLAKDGAKKFDDADLTEKAKEIEGLKKTIASLAPPPEPTFNQSGGAPRPKRDMAPMASPAEAMSLRSAHGAAMKEIQGE